jgi:hypothetical protein
MVTKQAENYHRTIVSQGFILATTSLLVVLLLLTIYFTLPSDFTVSIFAQEQNTNFSSSTPTSPRNTNKTISDLNSTQVDFVSNIEQIRGHLNAAVMNKEVGNNSLAKAHTLHPIAEIYSSIEPLISNANSTLNNTLASNLNQLSQVVNTSSPDEFGTRSQKINALLNQTIQQIIPIEAISNSTFKLGVVSDLLSIAGEEYGEAVENGTIKEMVEYQDGQAFISRAQDVFRQASSMNPQEMNHKVEEIKQQQSNLNTAIQNKPSPEVVDRSLGAIIHEISEITGVGEENPGGQTGGTEFGKIISEIRSLLNQTVEVYRQQNHAEAEALAITAYLDNFEFIESPLAEKDEALMENTEVMLREQLRQYIQNKVSLDELQQHIDKINSNLDKAEEFLVDGTTP